MNSSPTALRKTNDYAKAVAPVVPGTLDRQALDHVSVAQEGESVVVTMQGMGADEFNDGFAHDVRYLKAGEKLEGKGASFELVALAASGPGISKTVTNQNKAIPLEYCSPEGRRLTADELKARGFKEWELSVANIGSSGGVDHAFPNLRISLGSIKEPPGNYNFVGLFDARTKKSLVNGSSYSGIAKDQLGHINVHPRVWHATPMELALDVELDGKVVTETNFVPDTRVAVPGGEVRLLGVWDGYAQSWSSTGGSPKGPATLRLSLHGRAGEADAVALFVTEPPRLAVHAELLDERGREIQQNGGGSGSGVRVVAIHGKAADIRQVRFTVFTNHHRVVLVLPPIPNLPGAGQPATNLFDVRMPQVQIQSEYELRDIIAEMTELSFQYPPVGDTMPTNLFPMTFTNVTAAQLLAEYRQHLTNTCTVVVDEVKQEIRVEPTAFERMKRWVQEKLP